MFTSEQMLNIYEHSGYKSGLKYRFIMSGTQLVLEAFSCHFPSSHDSSCPAKNMYCMLFNKNIYMLRFVKAGTNFLITSRNSDGFHQGKIKKKIRRMLLPFKKMSPRYYKLCHTFNGCRIRLLSKNN